MREASHTDLSRMGQGWALLLRPAARNAKRKVRLRFHGARPYLLQPLQPRFNFARNLWPCPQAKSRLCLHACSSLGF